MTKYPIFVAPTRGEQVVLESKRDFDAYVKEHKLQYYCSVSKNIEIFRNAEGQQYAMQKNFNKKNLKVLTVGCPLPVSPLR